MKVKLAVHQVHSLSDLFEFDLLRPHADRGRLGELEILEGELPVVKDGGAQRLTLPLHNKGGGDGAQPLAQQVPAFSTGRAA